LGRVVSWIVFSVIGAAFVYLGWGYFQPAAREIPTARVAKRDFITTVSSRGELKSAQSVQITAPRTPDLKIVQLAESGARINRGDIVVKFDSAAQEDRLLEQETSLRQVESEIKQLEAQHSIADEQNEMAVMQSKYNLERAELEAGKQEILSEIEGAKNRIDVGTAAGALSKAEVTVEATDLSQTADLARLKERLQKAIRDRDLSRTYLRSMELRSPVDGVVEIMDNNRAQGSFGTSRPPFQEGDTVWTGAAIAQIPDLNSLEAEFHIGEIDRGRVSEGQEVRLKVDAVPDARLDGEISWLSPIAALVFNTIPPSKSFPALASIKKLDERLRPGMSVTAEVVVERLPGVIVIPAKASFQVDGKPTVFVKEGASFRPQPIEVQARNGNEIVVSSGLEEGAEIALENPGIGES
jgi:multidrug efflux pump subunit AcrA (membrane-fusion protein)